MCVRERERSRERESILIAYLCMYVLLLFVVQVHCGIPPSVAEQEMKLIEETVEVECCPETVRRVRETGAQVVRLTW